ncbi:hypothetical protein ACFLSJ_01755 [Verrucomicrobiota bacterium]
MMKHRAELEFDCIKGHERAKSDGHCKNMDNLTDEEFDKLDSTYYSFTSVAHHPGLGKLFCGTTNMTNDVLQSFDLETNTFESMDYRSFGERYEIKIHRSSTVGPDGNVYAATSALHNINRRPKAPGGKLFRFDPHKREYALLAVPCKYDYIQTISLDWDRQCICGMSYPVFKLFAYDLGKGEVVYEQFMGSISHIGAFDDDGGYWGTWGHSHHLFRYDCERNEVKYFDHGFPVRCMSLMYAYAGPVDCMINGGDGYLYIGHESGEIYRLDPKTGEVEYLIKPLPGYRMPALAIGHDGRIYGFGGPDWHVRAFAYDRETGEYQVSGPIKETESGEQCFRAHDLVIVGKRLFLCETDVGTRGAWLWECRLP